MSVTFLPQIATVFLLMFARLGTIMMLLPAFGEQSIPTNIKLTLALAVTLILYPIAAPLYPADALSSLARLMVLLGGEIVIGLFTGLAIRLLLAALQIAGTTIANQIGLAFAQAFDPAQGVQGALYGNFLTLLGVTLIFASDLHHLGVAALHDSFSLFPPGAFMPVGDIAEVALMIVAETFRIGIQIAAPFLVFGLIFYLGLGLLNRLMPQVQIFFVAMPANIVIGNILIFLILTTIMTWYLSHLETGFMRFLLR